MAIEVISRSDAIAQGLTRYFTGSPCTHGHLAERNTGNGNCVVCSYENEKRYKERNREKFRNKWRKYERNASPHRREQRNSANRRYASKNKTKIAEKGNRWRKANPEKVRAIGKRWRDKNRDKKNEKIREWHAANRLKPEYKLENQARATQWRIDNPEQVKANSRRGRSIRRARQTQAGGSFTQAEIDALLKRQNNCCANPHCHTVLNENRELDHIIPISKGGRSSIENLQWLCVSCNRMKADKDWDVFLAEYALAQLGASNGIQPRTTQTGRSGLHC